MKKILYMFFVISISFTISACSNSLKGLNVQLTQQMEALEKQNKELSEQLSKSQMENEDLQKEIIKLQEKIKGYEQAGEAVVPNEGESILTIYGANIDTYKKEVVSQVVVKDELPLEEKLDVVAEQLSQLEFGGLGIDLTEIKEKDGKKIAVVNLTEKPNKNSVTWNTGYFQGSTGGAITSVALHETFLQRNYSREWIDGVMFLYNNAKIEYDHVQGMSEVAYR